jgi:ribA/ribD-fused uncharacterized protein
MNVIDNFRGDYFFLSNFYMCPVMYAGLLFPSSEHAYMASKTDDVSIRKHILSLKRARDARNFGQTFAMRPDWDNVKYRYMKTVLKDKFTRNTDLAIKLLETKDAKLVEGGNWCDIYWGTCSCPKHQGVGKNALGSVLMEIREELCTPPIVI